MGHRSLRAAVLACLLISASILTVTSTGCASRTTQGPGTPAAPSPQYTIQQGLSIMADANKAATQAVIALNSQGVIPTDITREILKYNALVAQSAKSGTTIMQSNKSAAEKATVLRALMAQLPLPEQIKTWSASSTGNEVLAGAIAAITSVQTTIALVLANTGGLR